jgi:hypothetical protein
MTRSMITRKFHLVAAKKGSFDNCNNGYIDIYDEELLPHTNLSNLLDIC